MLLLGVVARAAAITAVCLDLFYILVLVKQEGSATKALEIENTNCIGVQFGISREIPSPLGGIILC